MRKHTLKCEDKLELSEEEKEVHAEEKYEGRGGQKNIGESCRKEQSRRGEGREAEAQLRVSVKSSP